MVLEMVLDVVVFVYLKIEEFFLLLVIVKILKFIEMIIMNVLKFIIMLILIIFMD